MRLHLVGLPHAHLSRDVTVCAFTTKAAKFVKMMGELGWEIIYYGGDESDTRGYAELIPLYSSDEQRGWYGEYDPNTLPIVAGSWEHSQPPFMVTNMRAIAELRQRIEPGDIVLLSGGLAHLPIVQGLPGALCVEWAAGYSGVIFSDGTVPKPPFVCFESHAWRHYLYGMYRINDGRWYDSVIPNFFDPEEWSLATGKDDHLLFVGRMISRKGPHIAAAIAQEMGMPITFAGSGVDDWGDGFIKCLDGTLIEGDVTYAGTVGWQARNALMGKARCLLAPTTYIEPFGAVVIESMLCGTPSVATDWGSFSELLSPARRFRTLKEGCQAVERAMSLPPAVIQEEALSRWSLEAVAPLYDRWFRQLGTLWGDGWYAK